MMSDNFEILSHRQINKKQLVVSTDFRRIFDQEQTWFRLIFLLICESAEKRNSRKRSADQEIGQFWLRTPGLKLYKNIACLLYSIALQSLGDGTCRRFFGRCNSYTTHWFSFHTKSPT